MAFFFMNPRSPLYYVAIGVRKYLHMVHTLLPMVGREGWEGYLHNIRIILLNGVVVISFMFGLDRKCTLHRRIL